MQTVIAMRGLVGRTRLNPPGIGRALVEAEYVKKIRPLEWLTGQGTEPEWTTNRKEAQIFDWEEARDLAAKIGSRAHALVVPSPTRYAGVSPTPWHRHHIEPAEAYLLLERRGQA